MLPDQQLLLTQLITLWAVLDPISHLSLFMAATAGLDSITQYELWQAMWSSVENQNFYERRSKSLGREMSVSGH